MCPCTTPLKGQFTQISLLSPVQLFISPGSSGGFCLLSNILINNNVITGLNVSDPVTHTPGGEAVTVGTTFLPAVNASQPGVCMTGSDSVQRCVAFILKSGNGSSDPRCGLDVTAV